jgi:hypothetical protein
VPRELKDQFDALVSARGLTNNAAFQKMIEFTLGLGTLGQSFVFRHIDQTEENFRKAVREWRELNH